MAHRFFWWYMMGAGGSPTPIQTPQEFKTPDKKKDSIVLITSWLRQQLPLHTVTELLLDNKNCFIFRSSARCGNPIRRAIRRSLRLHYLYDALTVNTEPGNYKRGRAERREHEWTDILAVGLRMRKTGRRSFTGSYVAATGIQLALTITSACPRSRSPLTRSTLPVSSPLETSRLLLRC